MRNWCRLTLRLERLREDGRHPYKDGLVISQLHTAYPLLLLRMVAVPVYKHHCLHIRVGENAVPAASRVEDSVTVQAFG